MTDHLARGAACLYKTCAVDDVVEARLKARQESYNGVLTLLFHRFVHVAGKLALGEAVGKARLLLFEQLNAEVAAAASARYLARRTRLGELELLRLALLKYGSPEAFADFIFWS